MSAADRHIHAYIGETFSSWAVTAHLADVHVGWKQLQHAKGNSVQNVDDRSMSSSEKPWKRFQQG